MEIKFKKSLILEKVFFFPTISLVLLSLGLPEEEIKACVAVSKWGRVKGGGTASGPYNASHSDRIWAVRHVQLKHLNSCEDTHRINPSGTQILECDMFNDVIRKWSPKPTWGEADHSPS